MSLASILNGPMQPVGGPSRATPADTRESAAPSNASASDDGSDADSDAGDPMDNSKHNAPRNRYLAELGDPSTTLPSHYTAMPRLTLHPYTSPDPEDYEDGSDRFGALVVINRVANIWNDSLNAYILQTRQREREIQQRFEKSEAVSHLLTAKRITQDAGHKAQALIAEREAEKERLRREEEERAKAERRRLADEAKKEEKFRLDEERRVRRNQLQQAAREKAREKKRLDAQEADLRRQSERDAAEAEYNRRVAAGEIPPNCPPPHGDSAPWSSVVGTPEHSVNGDDYSDIGTNVDTGADVDEEDELALSPDVSKLISGPPASSTVRRKSTGKSRGQSPAPTTNGKRKRGHQDASHHTPNNHTRMAADTPSTTKPCSHSADGSPVIPGHESPAIPQDPSAAHPVQSLKHASSSKQLLTGPAESVPSYTSERPWGKTQPYGSYPYHRLTDSLDPHLPVRERIQSNPRAIAEKRWLAIEDHQRTIWLQIARKEIPKVQKMQQASTSSRLQFSRRLSTLVSREARRILTRTKAPKEVQQRAKRVMRELLQFYRGNEKREKETKRRAEQESVAKRKKEDEMREARRQARKLNFLITQTELYSHFVGSKIKTKEAEDSTDTAGAAPALTNGIEGPYDPTTETSGDAIDGVGDGELADLDFDDEDETNLRAHAARNAQAAVDAAKERAMDFDAATAQQNDANKGDGEQLSGIDIDRDDLNFQNPTMAGNLQVKQPKMLMAELKEYQLKGLTWLANLYEQGINGILADEMGLGKTVQSISLMGYLAEAHDIWGPFLVIAPASTLHNWQQEISRFVPALKALPYWGNTKDRAVLRKFWNRKSLRYDKDAPFHVLITSYQLVVQDEKYFQRVKWQYMILDEAQAIKSSTSTRWKTLLGFHCRNRLLLTGTPIQNSMTELWALLHFIMPQLFDSHDEFSEWFAKDIESSADKAGGMNEHQLRRLHMILKPFMLRRIKKNVQNELGDKIEIDVPCGLTPRQKLMYGRLRENVSLSDLVQRATSLSTDDTAVKRLMNLIMQFRKVCNHPELFERADVTAPFTFGSFNSTANPARDADLVECPYSLSSLIQFRIPKLMYREGGLLHVPGPKSSAGSDSLNLHHLMNIWSPANIRASSCHGVQVPSWARLLDLSAGEVGQLTKMTAIERAAKLFLKYDRVGELEMASGASESSPSQLRTFHLLGHVKRIPHLLRNIGTLWRDTSRLTRSDFHFFPDTVLAPPVDFCCSDRSFTDEQHSIRFDLTGSAALHGLSAPSLESPTSVARFSEAYPGLSPNGIIGVSSKAQLGRSAMIVPQLEKLILNSGKLAKLDELLKTLKTGGHRVLIYFQMTKMIDLMEEFLSFRHYKYLRLDGGSTISERRDMVTDWQTNPEIFIFLLSTRAGGLGINLTAADTVIFYDSDWNPSNDQQAMDRAHRLGQKRQVTVYRLITIGTIDERILKLARTKKMVQDAVVGSSSHTVGSDVAKPNEVASLLLEDDELEASLRAQQAKRDALKSKQIENGYRGVRIREERKAERLASANQSSRSTPAPWATTEEDDEAFGFFANAVTKNGIGDGEYEKNGVKTNEDVSMSTGGTATHGSKKSAGQTKKRKLTAVVGNGEGTHRVVKKKSKLAE